MNSNKDIVNLVNIARQPGILLISSDQCLENIPVLLGQQYATFGEVQKIWLSELTSESVPPAVTAGSQRNLRKYTSGTQGVLPYTLPPEELKQATINKYMKQLTELISTVNNSQEIVSVKYQTPAMTSSFSGLLSMFRAISIAKVRLQLQEIFIFLCARVMQPEAKYNELLQYTGGWHNKIGSDCLPEAERFVLLMLSRCPPTKMDYLISILSTAFPDGIPRTQFARLGTILKGGLDSLVTYINRHFISGR